MSQTSSTNRPRLQPAKKLFLSRGIPYTSGRVIVQRGEIPVVRMGRAWYLDERDVDQWIELQKRNNVA